MAIKDSIPPQSSPGTNSTQSIFKSPNNPLLIDLGTGFGAMPISCAVNMPHAKDYNFIGCDLNPTGIAFSTSISHRWNLSDYLAFLRVDALDCLKLVEQTYDGPVKIISCLFPTPYSPNLFLNITEDCNKSEVLQNSSTGVVLASKRLRGNSQLPTTMKDFIFTPELVKKAHILLSRYNTKEKELRYLYIASNCADVADTMHNIITSTSLFRQVKLKREIPTFRTEKMGCNCNKESPWVSVETFLKIELSERDKRINRPICAGKGWLAASPFPSDCRAESDIAYKHVHRAIYLPL